MRIHVKICGFTRLEDALVAEGLGASAVGFVFYSESPRYINPEKARNISEQLGPFIARVGVFVDEEPATILRIVETVQLSAIQLHGLEEPDYITGLKKIPIIKAFRVSNAFNQEELKRYDVNAFLLDTYDADSYGGTGRVFDWKNAYKCRNHGRIILAGGLDASNVCEAVRIARPWGVDVSSGVESSAGIKDPEKMEAFFHTLNKENL